MTKSDFLWKPSFSYFQAPTIAKRNEFPATQIDNAIKRSPELQKYTKDQWQKTFEIFKEQGLLASHFLTIIGKRPELLKLSPNKLVQSFECLRITQFGDKSIIELIEEHPEMLGKITTFCLLYGDLVNGSSYYWGLIEWGKFDFDIWMAMYKEDNCPVLDIVNLYIVIHRSSEANDWFEWIPQPSGKFVTAFLQDSTPEWWAHSERLERHCGQNSNGQKSQTSFLGLLNVFPANFCCSNWCTISPCFFTLPTYIIVVSITAVLTLSFYFCFRIHSYREVEKKVGVFRNLCKDKNQHLSTVLIVTQRDHRSGRSYTDQNQLLNKSNESGRNRCCKVESIFAYIGRDQMSARVPKSFGLVQAKKSKSRSATTE